MMSYCFSRSFFSCVGDEVCSRCDDCCASEDWDWDWVPSLVTCSERRKSNPYTFSDMLVIAFYMFTFLIILSSRLV